MADGRNGKGVEALAITVDASKDEFDSLPGGTLAAKIEQAVHSQRCRCALWLLPGPLHLGFKRIVAGALVGAPPPSPTWRRVTLGRMPRTPPSCLAGWSCLAGAPARECGS